MLWGLKERETRYGLQDSPRSSKAWQKNPIQCHSRARIISVIDSTQRRSKSEILQTPLKVSVHVDTYGMTRHVLQSVQIPLSSFTASLTSSAAAAKQCPACKRPWRRQLSSTPSRDMTKLRAEMFSWLNSRGQNFIDPVGQNTNYLTDYDRDGSRREDEERPRFNAADEEADGRERERASRKRPKTPFPLNDHFVSQPILSEKLREEIWRRVTVDKKSIRNVSVELGVEMRRVGAVVRLLEVEKQWRAEVSSQNRLLLPVPISCDEQPKFDWSCRLPHGDLSNKLQLSDSKQPHPNELLDHFAPQR